MNRSKDHPQQSNNNGITCFLRVRYFETDQMQVAHHSHYFVWFEAARAEFCRAHGIDYAQMETQGLFMPIVEARCRYIAPARYDEEIEVHAYVKERRRATVRIGYIVSRNGTRLAEGETLSALVDREGRLRAFPPDIAARFDGSLPQRG